MKISKPLSPVRLRCYRERVGLSQKRLAERLGKTLQSSEASLLRMIQRWEKSGNVSPSHLGSLVSALETDISSLLLDRGEAPQCWWISEASDDQSLPGLEAVGLEQLCDLVSNILRGWRIDQNNVRNGIQYCYNSRGHYIQGTVDGRDRLVSIINLDGPTSLNGSRISYPHTEKQIAEYLRCILFAWAPIVVINEDRFPPRSTSKVEYLVDIISPTTNYSIRQLRVGSLKALDEFIAKLIPDGHTMAFLNGGESYDSSELCSPGLEIYWHDDAAPLCHAIGAARIRRVTEEKNCLVTLPWLITERHALQDQLSQRRVVLSD